MTPFEQGREAYKNGLTRKDDPYWTRGSAKACPESHEWCRGWDSARLEDKGETHTWAGRNKHRFH
jgi:hypothetical protein